MASHSSEGTYFLTFIIGDEGGDPGRESGIFLFKRRNGVQSRAEREGSLKVTATDAIDL